jgi:hypothetical protein
MDEFTQLLSSCRQTCGINADGDLVCYNDGATSSPSPTATPTTVCLIGELTKPVDIYAFGMTMFEVCHSLF